MKVKQVPGDFVVEERASIVAADRGRFAVYRLEKRGIGTLEALRAVRRAWRVPARAVGFGGLKDRHAETVQWVTIPAGPKRNLTEKAFRLTYQGKSEVPMSRMALTGNRFRLRLRDLTQAEAHALAGRFRALEEAGCPAYFDDQRFGSLRGGGGFAVLHLLRGDPEAALKAVVASPSREDRAMVRERKRRIRAGWSRLDTVLPHLDGTPMHAPVLHLVTHPGDYLGAFQALDREERRLLVSAYASSVWNRAVVRRLTDLLPAGGLLLLRGAAGTLAFPKDPRDAAPFDGAVLPLPSPKAHADDPAWQAALVAALAEDGLTLESLVLPRSLGLPFRATRRHVLFRPEEATLAEPVADDLNRGRFCLDLAFTLSRGLYATILLKRIALEAEGPAPEVPSSPQ